MYGYEILYSFMYKSRAEASESLELAYLS